MDSPWSSSCPASSGCKDFAGRRRIRQTKQAQLPFQVVVLSVLPSRVGPWFNPQRHTFPLLNCMHSVSSSKAYGPQFRSQMLGKKDPRSDGVEQLFKFVLWRSIAQWQRTCKKSQVPSPVATAEKLLYLRIRRVTGSQRQLQTQTFPGTNPRHPQLKILK